MKTKKVAFLGMMGALALVTGFLENLLIPDIPFLPVGAKPGLSNVVTMYVASVMGFPGAVYITLIKALFALITRGATAAFMSLCGGLLSTVVTCILLKFGKKYFSFWGIGVMSAVMHNMGQLAASSVISGTPVLINYGKYLLIFALITGSVTGVMLLMIVPRVEKFTVYYNKNNSRK
ncbi:MAG: Gx transporter family protein [Clostridia bacterium]|nr:Gx transporter family protein [Clostridia bacterium]